MKRIHKLIPALCLALSLGVAGMAHAQTTVADGDSDDVTVVTTTPEWSPFAFNAWAGIAYDYVHLGGDDTLSSSDGKLGANFGGDVGFRFSPTFALVGLFEYAPIFSSDVASHVVTVGGGLRFQPALAAQFLLGAGYSNLGGDGDSTAGFNVRLMGFYPVASGFGPYLQLSYSRFSPASASLDLFSANAGLSFSY
jgi:hypothetical protein